MLSKFKLVAVGILIKAGLMTAVTAAEFQPLELTGTNPGELTASVLYPSASPKALVVLLHGCNQSGVSLAHDAGWVALSKTTNTALLVPQQSLNNNNKACFNWFSPRDTEKDSGESLSVIEMIRQVNQSHAIKDTYIVGLSAGGAMTAAILANYPNTFKGGAVIAGLAYPCADNLIKAISCMKQGPNTEGALLAKAITPSPYFPPISVWTGEMDEIVHPHNATALAEQWAALHQSADKQQSSDGELSTTRWLNSQGEVTVELNQVRGMGHGIAIDSTSGLEEQAAPFVVDKGVSTARAIARFWKL